MAIKPKGFIESIQSWAGRKAGNNQVYLLGLPVDSLPAAGMAVAATFVYYLLSRYPDLSVWDSPLIALVAIQGGLGHPPGYPLHTMLGAIMAHLPGINPLTGVKLLSIVPGALMCVPVLSLAAQMQAGNPNRKPAMSVWLPAVFVMMLCAHHSLWDPATRVEVYSLAGFLAIWGVARIGAALSPSASQIPAPADKLKGKGLFMAGLALGASAAVHPVVAATTATAAATSIIKHVFKKTIGRGAMVQLAAGGFAGLLPYAWIPVIGGRTDRFIWGAPTDPSSVWNFLRARDFATNIGPKASTIFSQFNEWMGWSVSTGTMVFVVLGIIGWFLLGKRGGLGRSGPLALFLAVLAICYNIVWVPDNPDYLGYLCGPMAVCAAGGAAVLSNLGSGTHVRSIAVTAAGMILVIFAGLFLPHPVHERTRYRDRAARLQAAGALNEAPLDGILVVGSDHLFWPLLYLQEIEHVRRDVVVVTRGLAALQWYWDFIYRRHPALRPFKAENSKDNMVIVKRFLAEQPHRRLAFESVGMAAMTGAKIRGVGWMILDHPVEARVTEQATAAIEQAAAAIGTGSSHGVGTLSLVSYLRGHALWRLGQPEAAYRALLAGVPPSMRPAEELPETHWGKVPPLGIPIPSSLSITKGLGEPQRNLSLARYLVEPDKIEQIKELESRYAP